LLEGDSCASNINSSLTILAGITTVHNAQRRANPLLLRSEVYVPAKFHSICSNRWVLNVCEKRPSGSQNVIVAHHFCPATDATVQLVHKNLNKSNIIEIFGLTLAIINVSKPTPFPK
jgi:hypothetical protein